MGNDNNTDTTSDFEVNGASTSSDTQIRELRLEKVSKIRDSGRNPYPATGDRTDFAAKLHETYGHVEAGEHSGKTVSVAGRIMLKRDMGKLTFATLHDDSGDIQLFISKGDLGDEAFGEFVDLDLGDWISVTGEVIMTKKAELSVKGTTFTLLSKCLRPLPDKFKGMTDTEQTYRQRELDLIMNAESRHRFDIRHKAISSIRNTFSDQGYIEVEGPVLHTTPGGAIARPFLTHHNTLDLELNLRIALELHLKRLIVGGFDRVFEIGRVFRNEGLSTRHNPEFTMLESYESMADYYRMMELAETLISNSAMDSIGRYEVNISSNDTPELISLKPPYARISMIDLVKNVVGEEMHPSMDIVRARDIAKANGVEPKDFWGAGKIIGEIYDEVAERTLTEPTFVMDHPVEISPLSKVHRDDPYLTERFELVIARRELVNAFSELNDPIDQRERFEAGQKAKDSGDIEATGVDEEYLRALEYGLPPTGGLGIGIDRLIMLLAETSTIRDVVLFPTLRPEN